VISLPVRAAQAIRLSDLGLPTPFPAAPSAVMTWIC
jgi:hypothetical protein